jgi:hypothetical protein
MNKHDELAARREIVKASIAVPEEVRYMLFNRGYYHDVAKGYMIAGMRKMGFTESDIRKAVLGMRAAMNELTAEEAERVYMEE